MLELFWNVLWGDLVDVVFFVCMVGFDFEDDDLDCVVCKVFVVNLVLVVVFDYCVKDGLSVVLDDVVEVFW